MSRRDKQVTRKDLDRIRAWPSSDIAGLIEFVSAKWHWPNLVQVGLVLTQPHKNTSELEYKDSDMVMFRTGGWLDNERLMGAWQQNEMAWALSWVWSVRGGVYVFTRKQFADSISHSKTDGEGQLVGLIEAMAGQVGKQFADSISHTGSEEDGNGEGYRDNGRSVG